MNYDFARDYSSTSGSGVSSSVVRTSIRPITGLFGPKVQLGTGALRAFVTGKVGFIDFSTSNAPATGGTFGNSVSSIGGSGTHLAVYPGGGLEAFIGPVGLRADVGDEIYLNNGTFNNLRVTFGPELRF